jgi:hypothetical protein
MCYMHYYSHVGSISPASGASSLWFTWLIELMTSEIIFPHPSLVPHSKTAPSHIWDPLSTYPLVKWV